MTTQTAVRTPLAKMLQSFPKAYEKSNGWYTHDDNPRFDFREEENGTIRMKSWTGRDASTILEMGKPPLKLADLYPKGNFKPQYRERQFDLLTLSEYLGLDWKFLYSQGYRDGHKYKNSKGHVSTCVQLGGYYTPDGQEHSKKKVRLNIDGKTRFLWDQNTPGDPIPCGLHKLGDARSMGYLIMGEGESDWATMQFHGFPFLGISGADGAKHLDVALLQGIERIYILEEPDQAKKNQETGQGFYTSMRSHLRNNGYTGEIFSIRFQLATQHKDPSNLHKSIFRFCQLEDEIVFAAKVKEQFAEKMSKALQLAIPEGNATIATQEDTQEVEPPVITERDMIDWIRDLCSVPSSTLSWMHKGVLITIMLYSPIWNEKGEKWWKVDAATLAPLAGLEKKAFLKCLAYLANNLGLFDKKHIRIYDLPEDNPKRKICATELSIKPARSKQTLYAYPSTFHVVEGAEERKKQGGIRIPKPKCKACQSENVDVYEATFCHDCKHLHYEPKSNAPVVEDEIAPVEPIESTVVALPLVDTTDAPNLGASVVSDEVHTTDSPDLGITSNSLYKDDQLGCVGSVPPPQKNNTTDAPKLSLPVVSNEKTRGLGKRCQICKINEAIVWWPGDVRRCEECKERRAS